MSHDRLDVDGWQNAYVGIDVDPWLRLYRYNVQAYGGPSATLDFYRRLFMEAPVAIIVANPELMITDANIEAQRLFGRSLQLLRGRPFFSSVARQDRLIYSEISEQLLREPTKMTRPLLLQRPDHSTVEVEMSAFVIRDDDGNPEFVSLTLIETGDSVSEDIL